MAPSSLHWVCMRCFDASGPVVPEDHYCIPALERRDLDHVLALIRDKCCFVPRTPRQTGKTSALPALRDLLNSGSAGDCRCVHMNAEVDQAAREDREVAMRSIPGELADQACETLDEANCEVRALDRLASFAERAFRNHIACKELTA